MLHSNMENHVRECCGEGRERGLANQRRLAKHERLNANYAKEKIWMAKKEGRNLYLPNGFAMREKERKRDGSIHSFVYS